MTGADRACLVLMVGPPGSGKSTWIGCDPWDGARFATRDVFSLDAYRRQISGEELRMDATCAAADMLRITVQYRMGRRLTTVVDSTNLRREHRAPLLRPARLAEVPTLAVWMRAPLGVCVDRQQARAGDPLHPAPYDGANAAPVPAEVIRRLADGMEAPMLGEFDAVLSVWPDGRHKLSGELPPAVLAEPWLAELPAAEVRT